MNATIRTALGLSLVATVSACNSDGGPITGVDATGTVVVDAYLDANANGHLDATVDADAPGVQVTLAPWSGGAAVATGETSATGMLVLSAVPVGRYRLIVDSLSVSDTLQASVRTADVTVAKADTSVVLLPLTYPQRTVAETRLLPTGRKVVVDAVALTGAGSYPDTTAAVADSTGTLLLVRVRAGGFQAGDSVHVVGTRATRDGQPTLADASVYVSATGQPPQPRPVTAANATTAGNGQLDAALVRITGASILNVTSLPTGDLQLTVSDNTGSLQVYVDRTSGPIADPLGRDAVLDATGILVPIPGGSGWRLRPRGAMDVSARYPTITIAEFRTLAVDRAVSIIATALNGWTTFADGTVNVADSTGALRVVDVPATAGIRLGDSVRLTGRVANLDREPVLNLQPVQVGFGSTTLENVLPPPPHTISTHAAASASSGVLDAALVRVEHAVVGNTTTAGGDIVLTVDDGSGPLQVILDQDAGLSANDVPGEVLNVTGLLVPEAGGSTWVLKPRTTEDITSG